MGYFSNGSLDDWFYRGDLDLGFAPVANGNGVGFGFSLGIDAVGGGIKDESAFYPAIDLVTSVGKFSVGVPRSVLDRGILPESKFAGASYLDLEIRGVQASYVGYGYLMSNNQVYGARYDGTFGNTRLGFSAHNIARPFGDEQSYAFAVNHMLPNAGRFEDVQIYGAVEHLTAPGGNDTSYRIGTEGRINKTKLGLSYSDNRVPFGVKFSHAYLEHAITPDLSVSAAYGRADVGGGTINNVYGLGARYDFLDKAYVKASYIDTDAASTDPIWEAMVGWEF